MNTPAKEKSTADYALDSALLQMQGMFELMREFKVPAARAANSAAHIESAIRALHRMANASSPQIPDGRGRFVPDSECKQGKCGRPTVGCWGVCSLNEKPPQFVIGEFAVSLAPSPQIPDGWQIIENNGGDSYTVTAPTGVQCVLPNNFIDNLNIVCGLLCAMIAAAPKPPEAT